MVGSVPENQGRLFRETIVNPGAGNDIEIYPVSGIRWLVSSIRFTFTTDANVANRQVQYTVHDTAALGAHFRCVFLHVASTSVGYSIWGGIGVSEFNTGLVVVIPLPPRLILNVQYRLRVGALSSQVGDAFTSIYVFGERWIDD